MKKIRPHCTRHFMLYVYWYPKAHKAVNLEDSNLSLRIFDHSYRQCGICGSHS